VYRVHLRVVSPHESRSRTTRSAKSGADARNRLGPLHGMRHVTLPSSSSRYHPNVTDLTFLLYYPPTLDAIPRSDFASYPVSAYKVTLL